MGLAGYYRDFILNFAALAAPLSDLTRKDKPNKVVWGEAQADRNWRMPSVFFKFIEVGGGRLYFFKLIEVGGGLVSFLSYVLV